jgi:plasmid stability protein
MKQKPFALDTDVHAAIKKRAKTTGRTMRDIAHKVLRKGLKLKPVAPILASVAALASVFGGLVYIANAQAPTVAPAAAAPLMQPAPLVPDKTALAISEARADLIQAQANMNAVLEAARAAQGIPQSCFVVKTQWVQQVSQNVPFTPCMIPAPEKADGKK